MKSIAPVLLIAALVGGAVAIAKASKEKTPKADAGKKFFMSGIISWTGEKPPLREMFNEDNGYSNLFVYTDSNTPKNTAEISVVFQPSVIGAVMGDISKLPGETLEVMGIKFKIKEAYEV